jgi:hypothetical protein
MVLYNFLALIINPRRPAPQDKGEHRPYEKIRNLLGNYRNDLNQTVNN